MKCVQTIRLFLLAERTCNWHLHLHCVKDMLSLFACTGHNMYAKGCRLYLEMMMDLPNSHPWLYSMFAEHRLHTVRRSPTYWGGLSTDLLIEQTLMKAVKGIGGLTHLAMMNLSGLHSDSRQGHRELGRSRIRRDNADLLHSVDWLHMNNPNPAKTDFMSCATHRRQHHLSKDHVRFAGSDIQPSSKVRDLGVILDSELSFGPHIS